MTRLARRGHRIIYLDPDGDRISLSQYSSHRLLGKSPYRLEEIEPNLYGLNFSYLNRLERRLKQPGWGDTLALVLKQLEFKEPVALVLRPWPIREWLARIEYRTLVYYAVDEWTAFGGLSQATRALFRREEEALLRECDLALAVSPRLLRRFKIIQPRSYLLINAADVEHFAPIERAIAPSHSYLSSLPRPRLGFIGSIDDRLDRDLLNYLADVRPHWQFILVGRVQPDVDFSQLEARPNVHFLGYQPYESLPEILREIDVCLAPYRLTELTQSCWPLKVMEYLATGKPVVATPLESLLPLGETIPLAATPDQFLQAIETGLADPQRGREARRAIAQSNTWDSRVELLEHYLEKAIHLAASGKIAREERSLNPFSLHQFPHPTGTVPYSEATRKETAIGLALFSLTQGAGRIYYRLRHLFRGEEVPIRRILVERYGTLGDTVVMLPALQALRQRFPEAKIVLGVQPGYGTDKLLETTGWVDEIRVIDHLMPPLNPFKAARGAIALFLEGFDLVLCGTSIALKHEGLMAGIPHRWGIDDNYPLQALNGFVVPLDPTRHEADNYLALVESLDKLVADAAPVKVSSSPRLLVDEAAVKRSQEQLLTDLGIPPEAPLLTYHPGSKKPSRRWPIERYAELAKRLLAQRPDLWIAITGGDREWELVEFIYRSLPESLQQRTVSVVGKTDLSGLIGLLDRTQVLVCNDTGVMHLGRARGTPLVALLGPENHHRWGPHPFGEGEAIALRYEIPCAPCQRWDCELLYCLKLLEVSEAEQQVNQLLERAIASPRNAANSSPKSTITHLQHRSWRDLERVGYPLPKVTLVCWESEFKSELDVESAIAQVRTNIREHDYPNLEAIALTDKGSSVGEGGVLSVSKEDNPVRVWQAILNVSGGEFIVPLPWKETWRLETLSEAVATLIRDPGSAGIVGGYIPPLYNRRPCPPSSLLAFRRETLKEILARSAKSHQPQTQMSLSLWEPLGELDPVVEMGYHGRLLASTYSGATLRG